MPRKPKQVETALAPAAGLYDALLGPTAVQQIPIDKIGLGHNYRRTVSGIEELAADLAKRGMLQPILVRPIDGDFEIVFGSRRYRAAVMAGLAVVPAMVREMSDREALETQIVENTKREDVHPLEEADGMRELVERHEYSVDELAAKLGTSKAYIYGRLKLCALGDAARDAFLGGRLTASTALLVARIPETLQTKAVARVAAGDDRFAPSVREASRIIQQEFMLRLSDAPFSTADIDLVKTAGACTTCPKRTGNQPELFEDVESADVCTDPTCYQAKVGAHWKGLQKLAKVGGARCLTAAETKEVIPSAWSQPRGYVDIDTVCYEDAKGRTWKALVGKDVQPVFARDQEGRIRKLLPEKEARKLAKDKIKKRESTSYKPTPEEKKRHEEARRQREEAEAARERVVLEIVEVAAKQKPSLAWWKWLARSILRWADAVSACKRRGLAEPKHADADAAAKAIKAAIDGMKEAELRVLVVELLVGGWDDVPLKAACEMYGVAPPEGIETDDDEDDLGENQRCRVCGCTETTPCAGGCHWVDDDLCSACEGDVS